MADELMPPNTVIKCVRGSTETTELLKVRTISGSAIHLVPRTQYVITSAAWPGPASHYRSRSLPISVNVQLEPEWERVEQGAAEWDSFTICGHRWWSMITPADEDDMSRIPFGSRDGESGPSIVRKVRMCSKCR